MQQPLTARQLEHLIVKLIIVGGVLAVLVLGIVRATHQENRANAVAQCVQNAPLGWNCQADPTGYQR